MGGPFCAPSPVLSVLSGPISVPDQAWAAMTNDSRPKPASCVLLLAIARRDSGAIRDCAESVQDWEDFLQLAEVHRMMPTVARCLVDLESVPASIRGRLSTEYERNLCQSLLNMSEFLEVLAALDREQVPAMPFKGVVLTASAYGDLGLRACGDLDLLIRRDDLERATAIVMKRGFQRVPVAPDGATLREHVFLRSCDGMVLELRWTLDFIHGRYQQHLGLDWASLGRRKLYLAGRETPNMSPEKTLIMLCMHGSKHVWSRLVWVCDIAQLIASSPELDWRAAESEARALGLWKPLALGILLAHRIAGPMTERPYLFSIQHNRTVVTLAYYFQENILAKPGVVPAGHVPYNLRLLDFRDRMRLLFSGRLLQPNELDRAVLPFGAPQSLSYLARPIRLLLDRSAR